jgi:hypothetical protein
MWSIFKLYVGKFLNLAGFPAIVQEGEYRSEELGARIKVLRMDLSTLVSVNGFDVYFNRFTGSIEGIGFNPSACCKSGRVLQSEYSDGLPDTPPIPTHTQTTAD